jgi:hypothetical protein
LKDKIRQLFNNDDPCLKPGPPARLSLRICDALGLPRTNAGTIDTALESRLKADQIMLFNRDGQPISPQNGRADLAWSGAAKKEPEADVPPFPETPATTANALAITSSPDSEEDPELDELRRELLKEMFAGQSWTPEDAWLRDRILYLLWLTPNNALVKPKNYKDHSRGIITLLARLLSLSKAAQGHIRRVCQTMDELGLIDLETSQTSTNALTLKAELDSETLATYQQNFTDVATAWQAFAEEVQDPQQVVTVPRNADAAVERDSAPAPQPAPSLSTAPPTAGEIEAFQKLLAVLGPLESLAEAAPVIRRLGELVPRLEEALSNVERMTTLQYRLVTELPDFVARLAADEAAPSNPPVG